MAKMTPVLYEKTETSFSTLGIGKLTDCISCSVTEERNGAFELTMEYPVGGALYEELVIDRIICCYAHKYDDEPEVFRIYYTASSTSSNSKIVNARQLALHRMDYSVVLPCSCTGTATQAMAQIKSHFAPTGNTSEYPYTFASNTEGSKAYSIKAPCSLYDAIFADDTGLLAVYGGELSYHHHTVTLNTARGSDNWQTIKYGRNMVSLDQTIDASDVVTGIMPYWAKQDDSGNATIVYGTNKVTVISSPETCFSHIIPVDCTGSILAPEDADNDWQPTPAEVSEWASLYLAANYTGTIDMTVGASVLEEDDTDRQIHLCDTVRLYHPGMGINLTAKVVATDYNVLSDQWNSISIGTVRSNLAQTIVKMTEKKQTIQKVTTGGGNTGTDGNWSWETNSGTATLRYAERISETPELYGGYYIIRRTIAPPSRFASWTWNPYGIAYSFTSTNGKSAYTYIVSYDSTAQSVTLWLVCSSADQLEGNLTGNMTMTKSS